jgi:hypothetical protein
VETSPGLSMRLPPTVIMGVRFGSGFCGRIPYTYRGYVGPRPSVYDCLVVVVFGFMFLFRFVVAFTILRNSA